MIEGYDYFVRLVKFPNRSTPAQVWLNDDSTYDIYVDNRLSPAKREEAIQHELRHIEEEHFYLDIPIDRIERMADGFPSGLLSDVPDGFIPLFKSLDDLLAFCQEAR